MKYTNGLVNGIYDILAPLIGASMADATIKLQTKKIGRTEETLAKNDLPEMAKLIRQSLVVFIGSAGADRIGQKIENAG
jgi:hypothetical protein